MDTRLLEKVSIGALIHNSTTVKVYHGKYGNKKITARHYINYPANPNFGLIPLVLRENNFTHVLNYIGVAIVHTLVYYIYEYYDGLLTNLSVPLAKDGRMTTHTKQIIECICNGIEELRNVRSRHLLLGAHNIAVTNAKPTQEPGGFQTKIILVQGPTTVNALDDAKKQVKIDIESIAQIFAFCVPAMRRAPEENDFLNRLNSGQVDDLHLAFTEGARRIMRHPAFWTASQWLSFVDKVGGLLKKLKPMQGPMARQFVGDIRAIQISNWSQGLPNPIQSLIAHLNHVDAVDFMIGLRNMNTHYSDNNVGTQVSVIFFFKFFFYTNINQNIE